MNSALQQQDDSIETRFASQTFEDWGDESPNSEFYADLLDYGTIIFLAACAAYMIWRRLRL